MTNKQVRSRMVATALSMLLGFVSVLAFAGENEPSVQKSVVAYDIPDLSLTDADGKVVSLRAELAIDRPVIVNFIFTSCASFCPLLTATLAKAQKEFLNRGEAFRVVSISIDPDQDTPARLQAYAQRYRANPDWHFLTGDIANTLAVQRAFDAYRGGKMSHAALTLIRHPGGGRWTRFDGLVDAETLVSEYAEISGERL